MTFADAYLLTDTYFMNCSHCSRERKIKVNNYYFRKKVMNLFFLTYFAQYGLNRNNQLKKQILI